LLTLTLTGLRQLHTLPCLTDQLLHVGVCGMWVPSGSIQVITQGFKTLAGCIRAHYYTSLALAWQMACP
jgi:hypothetical protein